MRTFGRLGDVRGGGRRAGALMAAVGLAVSGAALTAPAASAAGEAYLEGAAVTGYSIDHNLGSPVATNTFNIRTETGDRYQAYCVEYQISGVNETPMSEVGWGQMPGSNDFTENAEYVNWILNNSYPAIDVDAVAGAVDAAVESGHFHDGLTEKEAVTATQAAIWHYSDGMGFRQVAGVQSQHADSDVRRLYTYLTDDAVNVGLADEPEAAAINLTVENPEGIVGELVGPFLIEATRDVTALSADRDDIELVNAQGETINLEAPPLGEPIFAQVPADTQAGEINIIAEINAAPVAGRLFVGAAERTQSMVMAQTDSYVAMQDRISLSWTTPTVVTPELGTTATDKADGDKVVSSDGVVVDQVRYSGLTVGQVYTVKGELMDKATNLPTGIKSEATFTAEVTDGTISLEFILTEETAGKSLVVFERLYLADGELVAEHADIDSVEQSVMVEELVVTPVPTPTETATPTPAPTETPAPTPTETPIEAAPVPTPTTSATPTPTETPAPAAPAPVETPAPTTSAPATPPVTGGEAELARTGAQTVGLVSGSLLLLAVGAAVLFLNRRRKG
ncbi:hypothetical protein GCM10009611_17490 [Arthrobacter roseus]